MTFTVKTRIGSIAAGRKRKYVAKEKKKSKNPIKQLLSPRKKTKVDDSDEDDEPTQEEIEDAIEDLDLLGDEEDRHEINMLLKEDQEDLKNHPVEKMGVDLCNLIENLLQGSRLKDTLLYTDSCDPVKMRKILRQLDQDIEFGGTMSRKKLAQLLVIEIQKRCGCTKNIVSKLFDCATSKK